VAAPALNLLSTEALRGEVERLRAELHASRVQLAKVTAIARDQAKALAAVTDDCPPWAPSVAICYWIWSDARRGNSAWFDAWKRIRYLVSYFGDLPAQKLTVMRWEQYRTYRRTQLTVFGTPPCDHTLNMELRRAKEMLAFAVERELIKYSPLTAAKPVKTVSQRETRLSADDIERLLIAADDVTDLRLRDGDDDGTRAAILKAFLLCCFDSLLRFNETRHLRRDRIRPDGTYEIFGSETKSGRCRIIVFTPRTLEAVARVPQLVGTPYIFASPTSSEPGNLIGEQTIRFWFRRACKLSGVDAKATKRDKRVRLHDARSGGASLADEMGARATAIRTTLGHVNLSTTQRYLRSDERNNAREIAAVIVAATDQRRGPKRAKRKSRES
jgi:integrase